MAGEVLDNSTHVRVARLQVAGSITSEGRWPVIVDLDGTLTPTDTLYESLVQLSKRSPASLLRLPFWLLRGRAALKQEVAARTTIAVDRLPYQETLLDYLRKEKSNGRRIILATAAHHSIAEAVASHLGLFDEIIASTDGRNLKGQAKLAACRERVGDKFVYAGDGRADLSLWSAAQAAILVGVSSGIAKSVRSQISVEKEFAKEGSTINDWLRALRVHHWLKNLLLFVPLLTAFLFTDGRRVSTISIAFLAFSFTASGTYILNDLLDLENDRAHPRKRLRPFASGRIGILQGLIGAGASVLAGLLLAPAVSLEFLLMLLLYLGLTTAYSWYLKQFVLIDVITLSMLYTFRILAGAVAIEVETSAWLLAFSSFVFLSLALVKRCSELITMQNRGKRTVDGRDYRTDDVSVLQPLGIGAAMSAIVIFGLFITDPEVRARYATPELLWFAAAALTYWLGRMWIKTNRGEMNADPLVYAVKDRVSQLILSLTIAIVVIAHFVALGG